MKISNLAHQQLFKIVFILTLSSGVCSVCLSSQEILSEYQERLFETSNSIWKAGAFTLFGFTGNGSDGADRLPCDDEEGQCE